jgi:hypothetical protein
MKPEVIKYLEENTGHSSMILGDTTPKAQQQKQK